MFRWFAVFVSGPLPGFLRGRIRALKYVNHHGGGADVGRVCPYGACYSHGYGDEDYVGGSDVCGRVRRHGQRGEDAPLECILPVPSPL